MVHRSRAAGGPLPGVVVAHRHPVPVAWFTTRESRSRRRRGGARISGNQRPPPPDHSGMRCETAPEAVSAPMDGERPAVPVGRLRDHLELCPQCRTWRAPAEHDVPTSSTPRGHRTAAAVRDGRRDNQPVTAARAPEMIARQPGARTRYPGRTRGRSARPQPRTTGPGTPRVVTLAAARTGFVRTGGPPPRPAAVPEGVRR